MNRRVGPFPTGASLLLALGTCHCARLDVHAVTRDAPAATDSSDVAPTETSSETGDATTAATTSQTSEASSSSAEGSDTTSDATSSAAPACPASGAAPGDATITVTVGTIERTYVLHVPAAYDGSSPVPLIIDFHGAGGTGRDQRETSPYPPLTDPEGVIMAFPDGVSGPIGTAWNVGPCCVPGVDDLAFVDALLQDVSRRTCIDPRRIYAVGVLTGGGMAHYLACERASVFAAVSPAAFDLAEETVVGCEPSHPVGVVAFRGTADPKVPYEGGSSMLVPNMTVTFLGAEQSFRRWAEMNQCTGEPSPRDPQGCQAFTNCADGVEVVLCSKEDGPAEAGDASIAWPILKRHQR